MVFKDQLNRTLTFSSYPKRIISLVPSQTELLFHLGLDKEVIGITKFCIYPTDWKIKKTIVGGTKNFKIDLIKEINPDLIIANKEENDEDSLKKLMSINQDTFIHSLLELNQWDNCFKDKINRYPEVTEEELVNHNPEIVFLSSEPFPFKDKHMDRFKQLLPGTRVILVNGEYFSWYGSRLIDSPAYFSSLHKSLMPN